MTAATSKMGHFVTIPHGCQPITTIFTASFILDVAAAIELLLYTDSLYISLQILEILNNL